MSEQHEPGPEPVTYSHDIIEHALGLWRDGWKQSTRINLPESWRMEYALAVRRVLAELQGRSTIQELMTWYNHEPPEVGGLLDELVYAPSGHLLKYTVIEDAAYWRRAQELLPAAQEGQDDGPARCDTGALDAVRRGRVLRGARSDVGRGDWVQWSWGAGARRETQLGIIMRMAPDGSWADVWTSSSLELRHDGYPAQTCRMVSRIRSSRLQVV